MVCLLYENETFSDWNDIFGTEYETLLKDGMAIEKKNYLKRSIYRKSRGWLSLQD